MEHDPGDDSAPIEVPVEFGRAMERDPDLFYRVFRAIRAGAPDDIILREREAFDAGASPDLRFDGHRVTAFVGLVEIGALEDWRDLLEDYQ